MNVKKYVLRSEKIVQNKMSSNDDIMSSNDDIVVGPNTLRKFILPMSDTSKLPSSIITPEKGTSTRMPVKQKRQTM